MNRKLLLDMILVPQFIVIILFVGILTVLAGNALFQLPHDVFDDSILSFDFLYFVLNYTFPLIMISFILLIFQDDIIKFRKKGDPKN
jgi:hypothetical protein